MKNRILTLTFALSLAAACSAVTEDTTKNPAGDSGTTVSSTRPIPPPTFVDEPSRLVAMGDVHGDYQATLDALKVAGAIDDSLSWAGGDMVLVQTGDQLDRGDGERDLAQAAQHLLQVLEGLVYGRPRQDR